MVAQRKAGGMEVGSMMIGSGVTVWVKSLLQPSALKLVVVLKKRVKRARVMSEGVK